MAKKQGSVVEHVEVTEASPAEVVAAMAEDAVAEEVSSRKNRGQGAIKKADDGRLTGNHVGQTGVRMWLPDKVAKHFQPELPDPVAVLAGVDPRNREAWREANRKLRAAFQAHDKTFGPMVADFLSAILTGTDPTVPGVEGLVAMVRERLAK